jgi:uroporphyrinogen-III synthase
MRVVVTRAAHQNEELTKLLTGIGAEVIALPLVGIAPPLNPEPLRQAEANVDQYDWIIFSSANAVAAFSPRLPGRAKVATIGTATRDAAQRAGWTVALVPEQYIAESLVEALQAESLQGCRILIPSAAVTRDVVPPALRRLGAVVDVVEAYRNVIPAEAASLVPQIFQPPFPDWITFASSSAVHHLLELVGAEPLTRSKIATIGPTTSATVRSYGLPVQAEGKTHTIAGLVEALALATQAHGAATL